MRDPHFFQIVVLVVVVGKYHNFERNEDLKMNGLYDFHIMFGSWEDDVFFSPSHKDTGKLSILSISKEVLA